MVLTILEATVEPDRAGDLLAAYAAAARASLPPGLVRSELIRDIADAHRWRIQTWWESNEALQAMRAAAVTPAGVLMFRAAGAEPTFSRFEVVGAIPDGR